MIYYIGHVIEIREYLDAEGNSPYAKWFDHLNVTVAVKMTTAVHLGDIARGWYQEAAGR